MNVRHRGCIPLEPTTANSVDETVIEAAMANLDAEYAALVADALISA